MRGRGRLWGWALALLIAVAVSAWSHRTLWAGDPVMASAYSAIGIGFLITAAILMNQEGQKANARIVLALSLVWMIGETARENIGPFYPVALFVSQFTQFLTAALLLRYPRAEYDRPARIFVATGLTLSAIFGMAATLTAPGAGAPPDAPGLIMARLGTLTYGDVTKARAFFWMTSAVIFIVLLALRWRRLAAIERRTLSPILIGAIAAAVTVGAAFAEPAMPQAAQRTTRLLRGIAGVGLAVAFIISALRQRIVLGAVADLVGRLSGPVVTTASVRAALSAVLGDRSVEVIDYPPAGGAATAGAGPLRLALPVPGSDGRPLATALFDPDLRRHHRLLESYLSVCGLALENSRLAENLTEQLGAVRDARARLVQAGLAERQRLERDLHDGAQQRLLALGLRLGAVEARTQDPGMAKAIKGLREELHVALGELRDLAHGIHPAVLTQAGLGPALESVVERLSVPVALEVPDRRWDADVESTAYLVACEALTNVVKHAGPCWAKLSVTDAEDDLVLVVADDGRGFDPGELPSAGGRVLLGTVVDRLAALGGRVDVESVPGHGTRVVARIPLDAHPR